MPHSAAKASRNYDACELAGPEPARIVYCRSFFTHIYCN